MEVRSSPTVGKEPGIYCTGVSVAFRANLVEAENNKASGYPANGLVIVLTPAYIFQEFIYKFVFPHL
jgi:hypothetical protein